MIALLLNNSNIKNQSLLVDHPAKLLGGLQVLKFFNKRVPFHGVGIWPLRWVLSQDESDKASQFWGTCLHLEVISDYSG